MRPCCCVAYPTVTVIGCGHCGWRTRELPRDQVADMGVLQSLTVRSSTWESARFGSERLRVQIPSDRP